MEKEVEKRDRIRELQTGKENGGREGERGRDKQRAMGNTSERHWLGTLGVVLEHAEIQCLSLLRILE